MITPCVRFCWKSQGGKHCSLTTVLLLIIQKQNYIWKCWSYTHFFLWPSNRCSDAVDAVIQLMPRQQKTKQHRILFHEVKSPWDLLGCFSGSGWDRCSGHRDLGKVEDRKNIPITATTKKHSHKQTNTYTRSSQDMLSNVPFVTPYHHKKKSIFQIGKAFARSPLLACMYLRM